MAVKNEVCVKNEEGVKNEENGVVVKAKRGRKSKKELMELLNVQTLIKDKSENLVNLVINENSNVDENSNDSDVKQETNVICPSENKLVKKRGRKPKGGKIIQQIPVNSVEKENKTNVILHLKCSMKDLQTNGQTDNVESYNFSKNDLCYETIVSMNENSGLRLNVNSEDDCDFEDDYSCKDSTKEIWRKLKQLEQNLHVNNVSNKRCACFWDTCEFDSPPIYIPKHFVNDTYHVYGCFCSPECAVAYLMNENIDSSSKFERYHLFNHIYSKIYDYKKNVKPAPLPFYMLDKYYGNLSIKEYRSLLKNDRLFLVVDKPLTKIMPELHEDNDDFILNNKIIPSNNFSLKSRLNKKGETKNKILNDKFGIE